MPAAIRRPDSRLVLMGFEAKPLAISSSDLIMRRIRIIGSQQNGRESLDEALDYAARGAVKVIARCATSTAPTNASRAAAPASAP